jgi:hypothetical protein
MIKLLFMVFIGVALANIAFPAPFINCTNGVEKCLRGQVCGEADNMYVLNDSVSPELQYYICRLCGPHGYPMGLSRFIFHCCHTNNGFVLDAHLRVSQLNGLVSACRIFLTNPNSMYLQQVSLPQMAPAAFKMAGRLVGDGQWESVAPCMAGVEMPSLIVVRVANQGLAKVAL